MELFDFENMETIPEDPRIVGVPHTSWRPNQYKAAQNILDNYRAGTESMLLELPTGSGKSALPTMSSKYAPTLVLVHTLGLLDQYEKDYGFDIIKGRPEYPCVLEKKVEEWKAKYNLRPTAGDCQFPKMTECPVAEKCPYLIAKEKALASKKMACTYRYAALSHAVKERGGIIFMDEAHDSVSELTSFVEFRLARERIIENYLPEPPLMNYGPLNRGDILEAADSPLVYNWIRECIDVLKPVEKLKGNDFTPNMANKRRLLMKFRQLAMEFYSCWWFVFNDGNDFSMQALSVAGISKKITENKKTAVMMSATIGTPHPLINQLGLETDSPFYTYGHPIPAGSRPVYDLRVPRMTKKNLDMNPALYQVQAVTIGAWIQRLDPTWRGIVLSSSYKKITELRKFLAQFLGQDRIYVPPENAGAALRVAKFIMDKRPGLIAIDTIQGWGSGLDLKGDLARFAIIAGVPHKNPTDAYEQARRQMPGGAKFQSWEVYNSIVQAAGRVSRGTMNGNDYLVNVAALADGSATAPAAMRYYPEWFKEAMK